MPFTSDELAKAGKAAIDFYLKNNPVDQVAVERPLLRFLMKGKRAFPGGKQYIVEQLRKSYDSNFTWTFGDAEVSYNKKDTLEQASYPWRGCHDGFALNEDELLANGITIHDGPPGQNTQAERVQLTNILQENTEALRLGFEEKFDYELHRDGTQDGDAVAGLDYLVATAPSTGTVGGINRANAEWWRNYAKTDIDTGSSAADLIEEMEIAWRKCIRNGGKPDFILVGEDFLDAFRKAAKGDLARYIVPGNNASLDPAVQDLAFHGVPMTWDPVASELDDALSPTITYAKRCYFLNSKHIRLRPAQGHDMITRRPPRVYNRYTYYWGLTWKGGLTMNRSSAHAVLSIK